MPLILPSLAWTPSPNYSSRAGNRVRLIVVHDCEGSYAGSVGWFTQSRSQVSAHIVLSEDGARATQMVAWANKAWHACNFNPFSDGIEAAGFAAKGLGAPEWLALANIVAFRLHENGIPCRSAENGTIGAGFCQHADLGAAGGGHHDITSDRDVWLHFVGLVTDGLRASHARRLAARLPLGSRARSRRPISHRASDPRHDLPYGSIEWIQNALNAPNIPHTPLTVDGLDGKRTRSAIVDFQERHRLFIDGEAGKDTCAALEKACADDREAALAT